MEGGMISVDRWAKGSQAYFLTHLHSDHTRGLSSTWSNGPLFCSRITAKLFPLRFPNFNFSLLRVVEIGSWHRLSLSSPSTASPATIDFMSVDALHCPGILPHHISFHFAWFQTLIFVSQCNETMRVIVIEIIWLLIPSVYLAVIFALFSLLRESWISIEKKRRWLRRGWVCIG